MGIYLFQGRWQDSEKQGARREALAAALTPQIGILLQSQGCTPMGDNLWLHEESDTICCFFCLPRTRL